LIDRRAALDTARRRTAHAKLTDTPHERSLAHLLARPRDQRLREYKYRCAQSLVFGIPVVLLHYFGHLLGGAEARLWSALLQIPLAGWVMYVGAAGMLFEGLLLLRRRVTLELLVACASIVTYLYSAGATLLWLLARDPPRTLLFHASVILIAAWTGIQWRRLARLAPTPDQQQQQQQQLP
jgi:cation transport ATPase